MAAGPLIKKLTDRGRVSEELLEKLQQAAQGRNNLAHEFLAFYMLKRGLGEANPEVEIATLQIAEQEFNALDAELSALSHDLLREHGIDPDEEYITKEEAREELRKMLEE